MHPTRPAAATSKRWSMLISMNIRCDQCGYESDSRYRFCGMCGAKLPLPPAPGSEPAAARPEREESSRPMSAPSFLGLSEEPPTSSVTYLLEDELSTSHWKRTLVLVICLVVLGIAGWHWRTQLHAYVTAKLAQQPSNNPAEAPAPAEAPVSVPPASRPTAEVAPASPNANAAVEKPVTGVSDLPANPPQNSAPPAPPTAVLPPSSPQPEAAAAAKPEQTVDNPPASTKQEVPTAASQISKSTEPQVQKPTSVRNTGEQLEADGERYLYGTGGVAADCSRALKDLTAAAGQGSAKAYSVLGTIYATGHCTGRDLTLAYHWFAKALQQDPGNTRLQRDLQVLWNQMSDDERQIAMRTRR